MKVNELSDADIFAISLVKRGANRQRFFLRKSAGEQLVELPGPARLIKAADWSAVYCVVAEPDALEDAGLIGDQEIPDRWASSEEIRKAAHRFMANGALVTKMHESLAPYGQVVENAIALTDIEINSQLIRKGSWYIAIAPTADGRTAIESGEFTGVSVEGAAVRTLVEKDFGGFDEAKHKRDNTGRFSQTSGGGAVNSPERIARISQRLKDLGHYKGPVTGKLTPKLKRAIRDYQRSQGLSVGPLNRQTAQRSRNEAARASGAKTNVQGFGGKKANPASDSVERWNSLPDEQRLQRMREFRRGGGKLPSDRKFMEDGSIVTRKDRPELFGGSTRSRRSVRKQMTLLERIAKAVGLSESDVEAALADEDLASLDVDLAKSATFGERMTAERLTEELPKGMDLLRWVVWSAIREDDDPMPLIRQSVSQFADWCERLLATPEAIAKQADLIDLEGSTPGIRTNESEDEDAMWTDDEKQRIEKLEGAVAALPNEIAKAVKDATAEEPAPTAEDLAKSVTELQESVAKIAKGVEALGAGGSSLSGEEGADEPTDAQLKKAFDDAGLDSALAGIL